MFLTQSSPNFSNYLTMIKKAPLLTLDEEIQLVQRWFEYQDLKARERLVLSHLRLVVKVACNFKSLGFAMGDLVAEGSLGLLNAINKFRLDMGCRLATYAQWWIKASIQEYILKYWSMLKVNALPIKKRLFCKHQPKQVNAERTIQDPDEEMFHNSHKIISLNQAVNQDSDELLDLIPDTYSNQEEMLFESEEMQKKYLILQLIASSINARDKEIIIERWLKQTTLFELAKKYGVSAEAIRQIEHKAIKKLQTAAKKQWHFGIKQLTEKVQALPAPVPDLLLTNQ